MEAVDKVLHEHRSGRRVALCRDCYGNHWADVRSGWIRPVRFKIELSREQYEWLRGEMRRDLKARDAKLGVVVAGKSGRGRLVRLLELARGQSVSRA